jgi:hypothetical protein
MTGNPNSKQDLSNNNNNNNNGGAHHLRGPSDLSTGSKASNNNNSGKPPRHNRNGSSIQNENSAHNVYNRDDDVQNYQAAMKNGTVSNSSLSGAALEKFND